MSNRKTSLMIAMKALQHRAEMDGDYYYDAQSDEEGYVVSLLLAMRHWCAEYGLEWSCRLEQAEDLFEEDLAQEMLVRS